MVKAMISAVPAEFTKGFTDKEREAELQANSPQLFAAMQTSMEELKRTLVSRGMAAPQRRVS